jgi:hypothetical protein
MAKKTITLNVKIDGVRETLKAFNQLPKDAANELRAAALELSKQLASAAAASGRAEGSQAGLVATTVKAAKDRVPVVTAGGVKRLGRNKKPAYKLLFGSEFGSDNYEQYRPHLGRGGSYWFYQTIQDEQTAIADAWSKAANEIIRKFERGG